jgi:hypothetical protein
MERYCTLRDIKQQAGDVKQFQSLTLHLLERNSQPNCRVRCGRLWNFRKLTSSTSHSNLNAVYFVKLMLNLNLSQNMFFIPYVLFEVSSGRNYVTSQSRRRCYEIDDYRGLGYLYIDEAFNVFHVRALYHTKTLITNKCTKRVLSSIVTHSYMFRPSWAIFRENFLLSLH